MWPETFSVLVTTLSLEHRPVPGTKVFNKDVLNECEQVLTLLVKPGLKLRCRLKLYQTQMPYMLFQFVYEGSTLQAG